MKPTVYLAGRDAGEKTGILNTISHAVFQKLCFLCYDSLLLQLYEIEMCLVAGVQEPCGHKYQYEGCGDIEFEKVPYNIHGNPAFKK